MKTTFEQTPFTIEITKDGSPTLRLPNEGESMHHFGGAGSETLYIYKSVMDAAYRLLPAAKTLVLGLGLGYIEMSWALSQPAGEGTLISFEKEEGLRTSFKSWLQSETPSIYDQIALSLEPAADVRQLKSRLKQNFQIHEIQEDLRAFEGGGGWNVICYDAFSSKTNAELWSQEFLDYFVKRYCAADCAFTTYACTGVLKKVMAENGFEFIKRPGFQGKRDSSLVLRGVFRECSNSFRTF